MLTSEKEAREKWCPMSRMVHVTGHGIGDGALAAGSYNRTKNCNCAASACAMWRWVPSTTTHKETRIEQEMYSESPRSGPGWRKREVMVDVPDAPTHGYCGLARRPEVQHDPR